MLGVLSLGLKSGAEITITAEGGDEAANASAVVDFIANITE
jgi:phosphotransferase system HPr-like phosphotransfer protein